MTQIFTDYIKDFLKICVYLRESASYFKKCPVVKFGNEVKNQVKPGQIEQVEKQDSLKNIDLTLYPNRWIAIVRGRVIGVGLTAEQAHRAAKQTRPKDKPQLLFINAQGEVGKSNQDEAPVGSNQGREISLKLETNWLNSQPLLQQVINILQTQQLEVYLVGGAVRDLLLGRQNVVDLDFAVPNDGLAIARRVANALEAAFYPLDRERGTGRVVYNRPEEPQPKKTFLDFATWRGSTLLDDLQDRDFTVNAIALKLTRVPEVIDPLQGQRDLEIGQIRAVSSATFKNDPVRVLRAIRQAVELEFAIEAQTEQHLRQVAPYLPKVSPERQRDELLKLLNAPAPGRAVQEMHRLEVLPHILPEIEAMVGVRQGPPHHLDVFQHTIAALEVWANMLPAGLSNIPTELQAKVKQYLNETLAGDLTPQLLMPLALLWHDAGKPLTRTEAEGEGDRIRFLGHERASARLAHQAMKRLHFSNQATGFVEKIVTHHMRPLLLAQSGAPVSRRAIYRFFRDTTEKSCNAGVAVALHALADHRATYPPDYGQAEEEALLGVINRLITAYFEQHNGVVDPAPLLTGRDLIEIFGLQEGWLIGLLLSRLKEAQAAGQVQDRAAALAFIKTDPDFVNYQNQG